MLRALCYRICQNNSLKDIQKTLLKTNEHVKMNFNRSKLYSSCFCSAYCKKDENKNSSKMSFLLYTAGCSSFYTSSQLPTVKTAALDMNKASTAFYKINMVDLKQVPLPAFWLGMCGLMPIMLPPLSSFIIGYSYALSSLQFLYSAALLSCMGGIKWGSIIQNKELNNWENYSLSIVPCVIAVIALLVPKFLGYLVLIAGFIAAFIIDLTTSTYPVWFIALRGVLTNVSVFFLFISMLQKLFH